MTRLDETGSAETAPSPETPPMPLVSLSDAEIPPLREVMRDLQMSVANYYSETAQRGDLGPRVRSFLVAGQTLNDLLTNSIGAVNTYKRLFSTQRHPAAGLIEAVKFARNVSQHVLHIVKPSDTIKIVGGTLGFRMYADWDQIPADVISKLHPRTRSLQHAYAERLQGHEVTGTMMSVLQFYAEVAPEIIHRDSRHDWTGFPLLSQPGINTRLHPEEPEDIHQSRKWMDGRAPGGDCRVVFGQVTINGKSYVYGNTFVGRLSFAPFVETVDQANFDIRLDYPYLDGDIAAHFDDVTDQFPEVLQGSVIASRGEILSWASPIEHIDVRDDWSARGVDHESWTRVVELECDTRLPAGFIFGPRRARRLNALVPVR